MSDKARTFGPAHLPDLLNDNKLMLAKITELDSIIDSLQRDLAERDATIAELRAQVDEIRGSVIVLDDKELVSSIITAVMSNNQSERDGAVLKIQRHILRVEEERDEREAEAERRATENDALRARAEAAEALLREGNKYQMHVACPATYLSSIEAQKSVCCCGVFDHRARVSAHFACVTGEKP